MKWKIGRVYIDRKGFLYTCVAIKGQFVVFTAKREDGSVTLAARMHNGCYRPTLDKHDYDIIGVALTQA